jgi:amino acid transporter
VGTDTTLTRGLGPWQATALNVTCIVGAGVFVTIPPLLGVLPGPYALCGWLAAGALILVDGLIWSELGATMPGSGGTYQYLLECYGRERWGRLAAFLFIWQFLLSGPLELGSGLVAVAQFSSSLSPWFEQFNKDWTWRWVLWKDFEPNQDLAVSFGPARLIGFLLGLGVLLLLYRNVTTLGRLTVAVWLGVMATIAWILIEGWVRFDPATAFDFSGAAASWPADFGWKLGPAMVLAMYSYLGYYTVCYVGDEVRDPGRNLPRAILWSALIVCVLFAGLHLAMLGTVPWHRALELAQDDSVSLPAEFMGSIHGPWAVTLVTLLLIWCCFGSLFAGMLGYSRIPYGAARNGHFFRVFAAVHPRERIPHLSLGLVGGLTLFWSFFDLQVIINALIVTRILEQFVAQAVGVMLLRRRQPGRPRPYRLWLYPLPCLLAQAGWLYLYGSSGWLYIALGGGTLATGVVAFLVWSRHTRGWPFRAGGATGPQT